MSYRRGLLWVSRKTLMVQPNSSCQTLSPLRQRGPGYRLPTDSSFAPLHDSISTNANASANANADPVTAAEIVEGVQLFTSQGIHPHTICFGGGHSEPIASFRVVTEAMEMLREEWHGIPLVVATNGLSHESYDGDPAQELIDLHALWRDAPGSDGDSKLSVWCDVMASNPNQYSEIMQPPPTNQKGFQEMAGFVSRLAEAGVTVNGTGSAHPNVDVNQVQSMALGMGCRNFFVRTYHPQTLYDVLGVDEDADGDTIKAAYLRNAKELHPDVNEEAKREECARLMMDVTEANEVLMDPDLREKYDAGVADLALNANETDYFASVVNKSM